MSFRFPGEPFDPSREPEAIEEDPVHTRALRSAVGGADAYRLTRAAVRVEQGTLRVGNRFVRLDHFREIAFVAVGRAAVSQALAVTTSLGRSATQGFIVSPEPLPTEVPFRWLEIPSSAAGGDGLDAASTAVEELVGELGERDLLILLLSPGALGYLARPPEGTGRSAWRSALAEWRSSGVSGRELDLLVRLTGSGPIAGRLGAAASANVATLVVDRGTGGALLGGGPTAVPTPSERAEGRSILERTGRWGSLPAGLRSAFAPDASSSSSPGPNVHRPVIVAEPADALRDGSAAVGEKRWVSRLGDIADRRPPAEAGERFLARVEELLGAATSDGALDNQRGLVVFSTVSLDLPEGSPESTAVGEFLANVAPKLRRREMSIAAASTSGGPPPGLVAGGVVGGTAGAKTLRPLTMRPGVTDVGILVTAVVPVAPLK